MKHFLLLHNALENKGSTDTPWVTQDSTYANSALHKLFHTAQNKTAEMQEVLHCKFRCCKCQFYAYNEIFLCFIFSRKCKHARTQMNTYIRPTYVYYSNNVNLHKIHVRQDLQEYNNCESRGVYVLLNLNKQQLFG